MISEYLNVNYTLDFCCQVYNSNHDLALRVIVKAGAMGATILVNFDGD